MEMAEKVGRAARKLIYSAFPEPHRCLACKDALTREALGIKLCHACSSKLATAIVFMREPGGSGGGPRRSAVSLGSEAGCLADILIAGGKDGHAALSKAVAHAVPIIEYMGVDSVYTMQARPKVGKDMPMNALGRSMAAAFVCRYMGAIPSAGGSWQDASISRYSGKGLGRGQASSYPLMLLPYGQDLDPAVDLLAVRGAVKIMTVQIGRYHVEQDRV